MDVSVMLELGSGISLPYSIRSKQWKPLYILAEKGHLYSCHFFFIPCITSGDNEKILGYYACPQFN